MNQPTYNINRFSIEKLRKDASYKEVVEKVRNLINEDRKGTTYKPLSYMAVKMKLDHAGYTDEGKIYRLLGSISDATNPIKTLWWLLKK